MQRINKFATETKENKFVVMYITFVKILLPLFIFHIESIYCTIIMYIVATCIITVP